MPSSVPIIVAASPVSVDSPADGETLVAVLDGVCYDEQLSAGLIQANVLCLANADASACTIRLYRGATAAGVFLSGFVASSTLIGTGENAWVPVSWVDVVPPSADVAYCITAQYTDASGVSNTSVLAFTVTTFPGAVNAF